MTQAIVSESVDECVVVMIRCRLNAKSMIGRNSAVRRTSSTYTAAGF